MTGPGDPVALVRVYIQYGKLEQAGQLTLQYLRKWLYEVDLPSKNFCQLSSTQQRNHPPSDLTQGD